MVLFIFFICACLLSERSSPNKLEIQSELRKVVLGSGNWFMMSPWFLGTSVFYDTVLIKERLNLMNKYHFSMHLSLILIKSFIINLQFYPFWRYYLKVSLIPGCCSQLVPENRHGFRKLVSRVSMFSQLWAQWLGLMILISKRSSNRSISFNNNSKLFFKARISALQSCLLFRIHPNGRCIAWIRFSSNTGIPNYISLPTQ